MLFSAFAPFGQLDFSSDESEGEKIYRAMAAGYTDPRDGRQTIDLSVDEENYFQGKLYATAMAIAAARVTLRRAHAQLRPETSYELLEAHEDRYGIVPGPNDSVTDRRSVLDARQKISRGPRHDVMAAGLRAILGAHLLAYRTLLPSEAAVWPTSPGAGPGLFLRDDAIPRIVRCTSPIAGVYGVGAGVDADHFRCTIPYENWLPTEAEVHLRQGDRVAVEVENLGLAEVVTVEEVAGTGASRTFTALFANGHDQNCSATTGPVPIWTSTKRFVFVVVDSIAAIDPDLVRRVDDFMGRVSRACTQWAIVQPTEPGAETIGPFIPEVTPVAVTTIGGLTFDPLIGG